MKIISILCTLVLAGCTPLKAFVAMTKPVNHFITLADQPQVHYEPGAKAHALLVKPYYAQAKAIIEKRQHGSFLREPVIHVTASVESYASYCLSKKTSGCVLHYRLFLSPKLFANIDKVFPIVVHELSHVQFDQHITAYNSQLKVPSWFTEGLATFVSDGGGAGTITDAQAAREILRGKHITLNTQGAIVKKRAQDHGLGVYMFYKQSEMFVRWLSMHSGRHFAHLLHTLREGKTVGQAVEESYGITVAQAWEQFVSQLETRYAKDKKHAPVA